MARLFPLFLATTFVGFVVMTTRYRSIYGEFDTANLVKAALVNIIVMPSFVGLYDMKTSFPFNPASWSIFFRAGGEFPVLLFLWPHKQKHFDRRRSAGMAGSGHHGRLDWHDRFSVMRATTSSPGFRALFFPSRLAS